MQRRRFVTTLAGAIGLAPLASCIADIGASTQPERLGPSDDAALGRSAPSGLGVLSFNVLAPCWAHPSYYPASAEPLLDRVARRRSIIDLLLAQAGTVDVIMLQEVAQAEFAFFNEALKQNFEGFYVNHAPTYWSSWITPVPAWEPNGNAIFVRRARFSTIAFRDLAASASGNHAALFSGVLKNSTKTVRAASIHLDSDSSQNRRQELGAVLAAWPAQASAVDVIAGDFNFETDAGNLKADISKAGYLNVLEQLGTATQTHPWTSSYNGADNWGIIDHIITRNSTPLSGRVIDFDLFKTYPTDEVSRINSNLRLCGSDHFPLIGSVTV